MLWVNLGLISLTLSLAIGLALLWRPQIAPVGRVVMTLGLQVSGILVVTWLLVERGTSRQGGSALMRRLFLLAPLVLALSACQPVFTTTGAWSGQPSPPVSTSNSHIVAAEDGRVVVVGGFQVQTGEPLGQTVVLDPASSRWIDAAPIPEPRADDVAVPLADGTLLVTGGHGGNGVGQQIYRSTWIFDPSRNRWNRVGDLHTGRINPSAVRLSDGRILLVAGSVAREDLATASAGQDPYQAVASAELYNPSMKTWSTAGDLSLPRSGLALAALPDGGALAAGGCL